MSQVIDIQTLEEFIEKLKIDKKVYNDTDFCEKVGIPKSYLSDFRAGRKLINEAIVRKIRRAFPEFAGDDAPLDRDEPTLGDMYRLLCDHDVRFHELANRILDGMGVAPKKEKIA